MLRSLFRSMVSMALMALSVVLVGCGVRDATPLQESQRRPNVLLIVADDLAYSDLGAFGGEIGTPNLDALAREGVLLANFYAASTCSPTRAMLLSGVDNHVAGLGTMTDDHTPNQVGARGYETYLNFDVAALPELLQDAGYHTYMTGKWHLGMTPETSPAARGFERSFGLMNGGAGHFDDLAIFGGGRAVFRDGLDEVTLPEDFYSTRTYADRMIEYLDADRDDERPFFAYLAFTAPHWPLQAPEETIARFAGRYDDGYDALQAARIERMQALGLVAADVTPYTGPAGRRRWEELTDDERRVAARTMEIYAAMVADLDTHVGRVLDHLKRIGKYDDTLVLFMSDNGAEGHDLLATWPHLAGHLEACCDNSPENMGRGDSYLWYGPGWARAGIGVFNLYKGFSTDGALRVPAIARLPGGATGQTSHAFATVLDVVPTVLELAGVEHPGTRYRDREVRPPVGASLLPLLRGEADAVHPPDHVMGWELFGRRAIRQGDWKLTFTTPPLGSGTWQLFDLATDPAELVDLSSREPAKRKALLALWDRYVEENGVIVPDEPIPY